MSTDRQHDQGAEPTAARQLALRVAHDVLARLPDAREALAAAGRHARTLTGAQTIVFVRHHGDEHEPVCTFPADGAAAPSIAHLRRFCALAATHPEPRCWTGADDPAASAEARLVHRLAGDRIVTVPLTVGDRQAGLLAALGCRPPDDEDTVWTGLAQLAGLFGLLVVQHWQATVGDTSFGPFGRLDTVGVFRLDRQARLVHVNPCLCRLCGRPAEFLLGDGWQSCVHPEDRAEVLACLAKQLARGRALARQFRVTRPDGDILWLTVGAVTETGHTGAPAWVGTVTDVTGQHRAEEERRQLEERLRRSERLEAIGQLAGGIAHDFNNQLAGIMGYAELLTDQLPENGNLHRYADAIRHAAEHSAGLTRQLLTFARKRDEENALVDLHDTVREVADLLRHTIDRRICLSLDLGAPVSTVVGDPSQLQSAILNLGLNARDAMTGGGDLRFATSAVDLGDDPTHETAGSLVPGHYLLLRVHDTGCGMDDATLRHIFEPFFTTKTGGFGTGLGLAAASGTVQLHGGVICVTSRPGQGSEFRVYLPLVDHGEGRHLPAALGPPAAGIRVLIVEDEQMIAALACEVLTNAGCQVTIAADGRTAVRRYASAPGTFDVVVLDLVMPDLDGVETLTALREVDPDVVAVFCTGTCLRGDLDRATRAGGRALVHKPFRASELVTAVARAHHGKSAIGPLPSDRARL